jgi:hypothetical protein
MRVVYYVLPQTMDELVVVTHLPFVRGTEIALLFDEDDLKRPCWYMVTANGEDIQVGETDARVPFISSLGDGLFEATYPANNVNEAKDSARFIQRKMHELSELQESWD